jgi:F0F1-type ATP synthase assembly protein I
MEQIPTMKKLYGFINRENVVLHMTLWGMVSGLLLGMLYAVLLLVPDALLTSSVSLWEVITALPFLIFWGMLFGGGAGLPMGIANGLLMGAVKQSRHLTLTAKKRISYGINLLVVVVGTGWLLSDGFSYIDWFFIGMPAIIATGASLLATDRHFNLLMTQPDARKPKAKRDAATA